MIITANMVKMTVVCFGKYESEENVSSALAGDGRVRFYFEDDFFMEYVLEINLNTVRTLVERVLDKLACEIKLGDNAMTLHITLNGELQQRFSNLEIGYERTTLETAMIAVDSKEINGIRIAVPAFDKKGKLILTETKAITWCERLHVFKADAERYWNSRWIDPACVNQKKLTRAERLLGDMYNSVTGKSEPDKESGDDGESGDE